MLRLVATALLVGVAIYGLVGHRGAVEHTLHELQDVRPEWLALAVVAEGASLAAYALIVKRLLRLGEVDAPAIGLLGTTLVGIAMTNALPGGQAISSVYWYRRLRGYGASRALAAIALLGAMVIGIVTLIWLAVLGIALGGRHGPLGGARTPILIGAGLVFLVRIYCHRQIAAGFRWLARRVAGVDAPIAAQRVAPREFATLMGLGYVNWLLDAVALLVSMTAVHASVPWQGVLVAYTFGQLASNVPLLPGGGGAVEASLALGLVTYGGTSGSIVAGVLLFRLISAWGLVPLGWLVWALSPARHAGT